MKVIERPSLRSLNTFGVDASAALRIDIESEEDVLALPSFDAKNDVLLGGGSNVLLVGDVPGTVLLNRIRGRHVVDEDSQTVLIEAGAGENWHELVGWTIDQGYSGLENLALIPGSVGAAPIQNIGAYGVELAGRIHSVTAWDFQKESWQVFSPEDCQFAYRDSFFKSVSPGRYLITSLRLRLDRSYSPQLEYSGLKEELGRKELSKLAAKDIYEAVIRIRKNKLPDPANVGNAGSFFKNPVVAESVAEAIIHSHPELPRWPVAEGLLKLSAAWMIEKSGLKGFTRGNAGISDRHALVLVNLGGASGEELLNLSRHVEEVVLQNFGIALEPEPRIVNMNL